MIESAGRLAESLSWQGDMRAPREKATHRTCIDQPARNKKTRKDLGDEWEKGQGDVVTALPHALTAADDSTL
jgi:hypothetical protein